MVYPGRPSTGCMTCRTRRIKCDEQRPHCKACLRTGRECPGYPHPLDVVLRPQSQAVFKRRGGPAQHNRKETVPSPDSSGSANSLSPSTSTSTPASGISPISICSQIPGGLYLPMEDSVTALFFNSYIYSPRDPLIRPGSMECLPQLYGAAPYDSHLRLGSLAIAYFSVAAWMRQEHLLLLAQQCFGKALSKFRMALMGDVEAGYDEILMTLVLLYIYEEFVAVKENKPSPKHHLRGAIALITSCSPERRRSPLSDTLTNAIQGEIICSAMDEAAPLVRTPESWPLSPGIPQLASSRLMMISATLVKLRERWVELCACTEMTIDEIEGILSDARNIDEQFVAWTQSLPEHWYPAPATVVPQSVRDAGVYDNRCDCYTDIWIAGTWNNYRTFRLSVQSIIYRCLALLPHTYQTGHEMDLTTNTIHGLAADICASVPYYLGSQTSLVRITDMRVNYPSADSKGVSRQQTQLIGGWILRPALETLCSVDNLPGELLEWAKGQLARVQRIYTSGLVH
ncbi:hypothetical protein BDV18DRAFT_141390 [Aspergillus unguis]